MQCRLDAKTPTDDELEKLIRTYAKHRRKSFDEFQQKECELEKITDMLWLVYEDYME